MASHRINRDGSFFFPWAGNLFRLAPDSLSLRDFGVAPLQTGKFPMFDDLVSAPYSETKRLPRFPRRFISLCGAIFQISVFAKPSALCAPRMNNTTTCRHFETTKRGVVEKAWKAILSFAHAFEVHSLLSRDVDIHVGVAYHATHVLTAKSRDAYMRPLHADGGP